MKLLLIFNIPFLHYCFNLKSSIHFFSFFWRYISFFRYFFFILICNCFWIFFCKFFEMLVILSADLLPIKSPVASAFFKNYSFWWRFKCIFFRLFRLIKKIVTISAIQNSIAFYKYWISRLNWISRNFLYFTL